MQNLIILSNFIKSLKSKNLFLVALIAGILSCALLLPLTANNRAPQAKSFYSPSSTNYVPGEVLLKFKKGTSQIAANSANNKVRATLMKKLQGPSSEILRVKLPKDASVEDAIDEYMKDPNVEFAEPNYIRTLHATATEYTYLWGINNTGQLVNNVAGTTDADMDVLNFWTASGTTGASTIIIAVIDSGVLWSHVDLTNNIYANTVDTTEDTLDQDANGYTDDIRGWDFVNHDNNPNDDYGHGTHVAGIIAADGSNDKGMTGVMQDAQILPLKACNSSGTCATADVVDAINYAVQRKSVHSENVKIINLSLGGADYSSTEYDAVKGARDAGILVVASAGNSGTNNDTSPVYPASYELANIISVAATDQTDLIATSGVNGATFSSNYGATSVDVAAPGINITSTYIASGVSSTYSFQQGTSMAAPHVAGTAGLLWAVNTGWTFTQVRNAILNNVDTKLCLSNLVATNGRVNANQARTSAVDLATPTGLAAASASSTAINLTWTDTASEDGYNIYRKRCGFACST